MFRHTFCTTYAQAGMDIKNLQYLMGHSDAGVTLNVYTHANYAHVADQMAKITEFRKKPVQKWKYVRPTHQQKQQMLAKITTPFSGTVTWAVLLITKGQGLLVIPQEHVPEFKHLLVAYYEGRDNGEITEFMRNLCWRTF